MKNSCASIPARSQGPAKRTLDALPPQIACVLRATLVGLAPLANLLGGSIQHSSRDLASSTDVAPIVSCEARCTARARCRHLVAPSTSTSNSHGPTEPKPLVVEYSIRAGRVAGRLLSPAKGRWLDLGASAPTLAEVLDLCSYLKVARRPEDDIHRRLGRQVLDPMLREAQRQTAQPLPHTLYIRSEGELAQLPFATLLVDDPLTSKVVLLIERFNVARIEFARSPRPVTNHRACPTARQCAFFGIGLRGGDAAARAQSLQTAGDATRAPLPYAINEVVTVGQLFAHGPHETACIARNLRLLDPRLEFAQPESVGGESVRLVLADDATKTALLHDLLLREAMVVHFAGHSRASSGAFNEPMLMLARPPWMNQGLSSSYLTTNEISQLNLKADLVVFSACATNYGAAEPGTGARGSARAGLQAGARSVVATRWCVDDCEAQRLMVDFYALWTQGNISRATALSAAKRMAMKRGVPMQTWSAFVLWETAPRNSRWTGTQSPNLRNIAHHDLQILHRSQEFTEVRRHNLGDVGVLRTTPQRSGVARQPISKVSAHRADRRHGRLAHSPSAEHQVPLASHHVWAHVELRTVFPNSKRKFDLLIFKKQAIRPLGIGRRRRWSRMQLLHHHLRAVRVNAKKQDMARARQIQTHIELDPRTKLAEIDATRIRTPANGRRAHVHDLNARQHFSLISASLRFAVASQDQADQHRSGNCRPDTSTDGELRQRRPSPGRSLLGNQPVPIQSTPPRVRGLKLAQSREQVRLNLETSFEVGSRVQRQLTVRIGNKKRHIGIA